MRIAIYYETRDGHTGLVADRIAQSLKSAGHEAAVKKCREATREDVSAAQAILVGSSVQMGRHRSKAVSFVKSNLEALQSKPSGFFSVSMTARLKNEKEKEEMDRILSGFEKESGWRPARLACFAGGLPYRKYGFLLRWIMRKIARSQGNDVDTSMNHVYTDWDQVDRFAAEFAADIEHRSLA